MFRLLVDFNEVHDDCVRGLQEYAEGPRPLRKGDAVLVHDDGGEEALATVREAEGDLVTLAVNWSTFGAAGRQLQSQPTGVWVASHAVMQNIGGESLFKLIGQSGPGGVVLDSAIENSNEKTPA